MGKFVEQVITCLNNCDIKIDEKMFDEANNFIAILGPPGSGKSTYCNTYYQYLLGTDIEYFQTQESKQTVTKGIWVLKKEVKSTSKNYIKRDIIDVEGFQTDSQACWKYAQAISLIATDIIILNQNTRMDEVIKIFKIIVQSIKMSNQGGIPQQLKQISISNKTEKQAKNFNVEEFLHLAEVQKADLNQIQVKSIYIPQISEDIKEEEGYDIYKDPKLVQSFIKSLNTISNSTNIQSVSQLKKYSKLIQDGINQKDYFNSSNFKKMLEGEYQRNYEKCKKQRQLYIKEILQDEPLQSLNESLENYLKRLKIDLKFFVNKEDFLYKDKTYQNIYDQISKNYNHQIQPNEFIDIYNFQRQLIQDELSKQKIKADQKQLLVKQYQQQEQIIKQYIKNTSFRGKFPNKWDLCTIKLDIDGKRDFEIALEGVYDYYKGLQEQKFDCLIQQSKYIYVAQSTGDLRCENGCKLNGKIVCGDCNGNLYWIKGSQNYVVCKDCDDVSQLISKVCSGCNGKSFSDIKYEKDFLNQKV
ncbi:hypothetical protein ABPG74_014014 [Tetrahymena malaccensis]